MKEPKVYVGTYAKYTGGSIEGKWLELENYSDSEEFYEACRELHSDEDDPEFMFQDWEDIPDRFISEMHLDSDFWEYWEKLKDMDEDRAEAYEIYLNAGYCDEDFEDAYCGKYDDEEDYAYELVQDIYNLDKMMGSLSIYFDYELFARDLFLGDYWMEDGHVFRNI